MVGFMRILSEWAMRNPEAEEAGYYSANIEEFKTIFKKDIIDITDI